MLVIRNKEQNKLAAHLTMIIRNMFRICFGFCKTFSARWRAKETSTRRGKPVRFSRRKHLRYRRRLWIKRSAFLQPIDEHSFKEYLETDSQKQQREDLNISVSDRALARLNEGWTLGETFGLQPKPSGEGSVPGRDHAEWVNGFIFDCQIKPKQHRRKLNYHSLLTEFLTDMQIIHDCYKRNFR